MKKNSTLAMDVLRMYKRRNAVLATAFITAFAIVIVDRITK